MKNIDPRTVDGFGLEWASFDQNKLDAEEKKKIFDDYFLIFPWARLRNDAVGADIGCGSGRWASVIAPRVGFLHLVDASVRALEVARRNLHDMNNCGYAHASVGDLPFPDGSLDFAYSLGVLHHVPDTADAIRVISAKLKTGAPLLLYLYYAFDNRSLWYKALWRASDIARRIISKLPFRPRHIVSQLIASLVYWPLARLAKRLDEFGIMPTAWPLAYYRDKTFYVMRTDALDRFGTRLERRFTKKEIEFMLHQAGLMDVQFSDRPPYWCVVALKR